MKFRAVRSSAVVLALSASGCFLFETPCGKVAGSVCTIPGEEATCTWLKSVARDNTMAQDVCTKVEPDAAAYAKEPGNLLARGKWALSSAGLRVVGFVGDLTKTTNSEKADKAVEKAGEKLKEAGEAVGDAVKEVGNVVGGAIDEAKK